MMWKILIMQIKEEINYTVVSYGLFSEEQRGCHIGPSGTGDLRSAHI